MLAATVRPRPEEGLEICSGSPRGTEPVEYGGDRAGSSGTGCRRRTARSGRRPVRGRPLPRSIRPARIGPLRGAAAPSRPHQEPPAKFALRSYNPTKRARMGALSSPARRDLAIRSGGTARRTVGSVTGRSRGYRNPLAPRRTGTPSDPPPPLPDRNGGSQSARHRYRRRAMKMPTAALKTRSPA